MNDGKKDKKVEESESTPEPSQTRPEPEETEKEIEAEEKAEEEAVDEAAKTKEEEEDEDDEDEEEEKESFSAEASKDKEKESPQTQTPAQSNNKPKEEPKKEIKVFGKLATIIKDIEVLSVLELADLVKALEDRFGVTAAAPVAVAAGAVPSAGGEEAPAEEQTTFNVILATSGSNKIGVIKAVREVVPTLGLKEAKDLVEAAPKPVLEGVGKDAANEAKGKLEAAGAKVELQ